MRTKEITAFFLSLALAASLLAGVAPPRLQALSTNAAGSVYATDPAPEMPSAGTPPEGAAPVATPNSNTSHATSGFPASLMISSLQASKASSPLTFQDTTAPQIFNTSPVDGAITGPSIAISANYSDPAPSSGIKLSTAMIHIDNVHQSASIPTDTGISVQKSGLTDGSHKIQIFICDNDYNCSSKTWYITVDATAPVISGPQPTGTINTASTIISAALSDGSGTGVNPGSTKVTIDGNNSTSTCMINASSASCPVSGLAPGSHSVVIEVSDNVGNQALKSWGFDVNPASIGVSGQVPAAGSWQKTASPFIGVSFQAAPQGTIDMSSITVELDGADVTAQTSRSQEGASFTPETTLAEGPHVVRVSVHDDAGHSGESQWGFSVDTIPPEISGESPSGNTAASPQIKGIYSDGGSGINPASVSLALDGSVLTSAATISASGISYTPNPALASGVHTAQLTAADNAGNVQTAAWSFTVADSPATPAPRGGAFRGSQGSSPGYWVSYSNLGSSNFGGSWMITGFTAWPNMYYLPWYDPQPATDAQKSELLITNQGAGEATVNIFVAGQERWSGSIAQGEQEIRDLPGAAGGPVKVVCPTGQALAVSHRVTGPDFVSETAAAPEDSLEPESVLPWYELHPGGSGEDSLAIANTGGEEAAVDVYMGDPALPDSLKGHYSIAPSSAAVAQLPDSGGPVRIISTNNQPLIVGQQATFKGSFTENLAMGISRLAPDYIFSESTGRQDQIIANIIHLGNPGSVEINVQLSTGGHLLLDPDDPGNDFFAIPANGSRSVQLGPGTSGQIEINCPGCTFGESLTVNREIVRNSSLSYLAGSVRPQS